MTRAADHPYDIAIAGGGLQAGLLLHALQHYQPQLSVLLLEQLPELAGNHTWSFHATDVPGSATAWTNNLPVQTWPGQKVCFPEFERQLQLTYCSLASSDMRRSLSALVETPPRETRSRQQQVDVITGVTVNRLADNRVRTTNGRDWTADLLIDCRGNRQQELNSGSGFQKFHGLEIETTSDWPNRLPTLMDARVDQSDGFRFMYILPLRRRRILVENTFFSDCPGLNRQHSMSQIRQYLAERGFSSFEIVRSEEGCLPMPWSRSTCPEMPTSKSVLKGGFGGGWFHAATGYSFPLAVRFAEAVANGPLSEAWQRVAALIRQHRFQAKWSRFLNRMLFRLVRPEYRWQIFHRFYRVLPESSIERFYSHQFTAADLCRILTGKPPAGLRPVQFLNSWKEIPCPAR